MLRNPESNGHARGRNNSARDDRMLDLSFEVGRIKSGTGECAMADGDDAT